MNKIIMLLIICPFYLVAQINVNSNFERGNGTTTYINNINNEVHLLTEYKGGDFYRMWYYAEITGLNSSLPLFLQIDADFAGPFCYYSYDNINWQRQQIAGSQFSIPLLSSNIYVAASIPNRYTDMINLVDSIGNANNGYTLISTLTNSEEGRRVPLLRITAPTCESYADKGMLWLIGGHHAAEDPARHVTAGMLRFFVSNDTLAKRLRKEAIIYVAPIMDVDQIYNGGNGKDQSPVDFNRDYISLAHPSHWNAVQAVKDTIENHINNHPYVVICRFT